MNNFTAKPHIVNDHDEDHSESIKDDSQNFENKASDALAKFALLADSVDDAEEQEEEDFEYDSFINDCQNEIAKGVTDSISGQLQIELPLSLDNFKFKRNPTNFEKEI